MNNQLKVNKMMGYYLKKCLVPSALILFFWSSFSAVFANTLYFPLVNNQVEKTEWSCKCPNNESCQLTAIQGKEVLTIPSQCRI